MAIFAHRDQLPPLLSGVVCVGIAQGKLWVISQVLHVVDNLGSAISALALADLALPMVSPQDLSPFGKPSSPNVKIMHPVLIDTSSYILYLLISHNNILDGKHPFDHEENCILINFLPVVLKPYTFTRLSKAARAVILYM